MFEHDLMNSEGSGNQPISATESKKPVNLSTLADKNHKAAKSSGPAAAEDVSAMKAYSLAVA